MSGYREMESAEPDNIEPEADIDDPSLEPVEPSVGARDLRKALLKEKTECPQCKIRLSRKFLQHRHRCASMGLDIEALREELHRRAVASFERRVSATTDQTKPT